MDRLGRPTLQLSVQVGHGATGHEAALPGRQPAGTQSHQRLLYQGTAVVFVRRSVVVGPLSQRVDQ